MDPIQNNSPSNSNNTSSSNSPTSSSRQRQLQHHIQQQRLLVQQQQQQLYSLLPQTQSQSYSPQTSLPPISTPSASLQPQYFTDSPTQTSPPNSASATGIVSSGWPSHHRTSNSRDEIHPSRQQQYKHEYQLQQHLEQQQREQEQHFKRERDDVMSYSNDDRGSFGSSSTLAPQPPPPRTAEDPMPSTSDFVKKLYKMLEDPAFQSVVCWGPLGDCFVVKDMNEFTKSILPRMFKHSNFASFVRQLNKYDFHKVKNTDDNQFGEHSWTFRHPDFHADRRDALENIKRKVPAQRKPQTIGSSTSGAVAGSGNASASTSHASHPNNSLPYSLSSNSNSTTQSHHLHTRSPSPTHSRLTAEVQRLKDEGEDLRGRIRNLERNYENVLVEMVGFQRGMAQQDGLMQSLIAYFLGSKLKASSASGGGLNSNSQTPQASSISMSIGHDAAPGSTPERGNKEIGQSSQAHQLLKQQIQAHLQNQSQHQPSPAAAAAALQLLSSGPARVSQSQSQRDAPSQRRGQSQNSPNIVSPSLGLSDQQNLCLPEQAVQRILGTNASNTESGTTSTTSDLGRATLMQMSELSRRAVAGGRGWSGMSASQESQSQNPLQKLSRADALAQIRDLHLERLNQGGWANAPQPPTAISRSSGLGSRGQSLGRGGFGEEREKHKERERARERDRDRDLEFEQDSGRDAMMGSSMDRDSERRDRLGEEDERRRREPRRRTSDGFTLLRTGADMDQDRDTDLESSPEEYVMPSQSQSSLAGPSSAGQQSVQGGQQQSAAPSPWSAMMSTPPNLGLASGDCEAGLSHDGLQVYTVGHLLPRDAYVEDAQGNWSFDTSGLTPSGIVGDLGLGGAGEGSSTTGNQGEGAEEVVRPTLPSGPSVSSSSGSTSMGSTAVSSEGSQKIRVRRSTFVPGWAVPPRVLLVDDDAVTRKLSSKFLKVFGCTTDVAVDGVSAVNKMNLEKYDLVLMDIVMPKLDGVSATNLIRKFDQGTPIISMTSNSRPNEIMTYYSSGMNDILPKPFTKEGLLDMLEKHLMHLKLFQQMSKVPRSVGVPPLSDTNFEQALTTSANNLLAFQQGSGSTSLTPSLGSFAPDRTINSASPFNFQFFGDGSDDDGRINPLAGMGLTDQQYSLILQNIMNGDGLLGMMDSVNGGAGSGFDSASDPTLNSPTAIQSFRVAEKRPLEDEGDERDGKRSRFEVIE
ncbi:hypothetical protein GALMADRAFT_924624 [Galerina marginata CBS 339.88]|uniref:Response regulatory domain-containing protein n=1 Tax=Galerina marginata (strain CBS 339.88) TaxID=685588 RepID=A0A067SNC2_GALM3|nr:hypothetical protein GALMADRAFT_924624 [Galerina marginata CBS 339.88]